MKRTFLIDIIICLALILTIAGCATVQGKMDSDTGPKPAEVVPDMTADDFKVDHAEQFPIATAGERVAAPELNVTGVVSPDVSRQVPVPSLASGRILEIDARLGDVVKKGQLLFKIRSTDIAGAVSDYRKASKNEQLAVQNENLAKIQLERATNLYDAGKVYRPVTTNVRGCKPYDPTRQRAIKDRP